MPLSIPRFLRVGLVALAIGIGGERSIELEEIIATRPSHSASEDYKRFDIDIKGYKSYPNAGTLEDLFRSTKRVYNRTKQDEAARILFGVDAGDIVNKLEKVRIVNSNYDRNINALLRMFDDPSFRSEFIKKYSTTETEIGGYIRRVGKIFQITQNQNFTMINEVKKYIGEFKAGNYSHVEEFLRHSTKWAEFWKVGANEKEAKALDVTLKRTRAFLYFSEFYQEYLKNPDKAKRKYSNNPDIEDMTRDIIRNIDLVDKTAIDLLIQGSLDFYELIGKYISSGITQVTPLQDLKDVNDVVANYHTHPYGDFIRDITSGINPSPPSGQDLRSSISIGHNLVFSFGKDKFVIYGIRFGEISVLREYTIDPNKKP